MFGVLAVLPEVYVIAIALAAIVPLIYRRLPGARGAVLALFFPTLAPLLLYALHSGLKDWTVVLGLSFAYALGTIVVFRLVMGGDRGVAES